VKRGFSLSIAFLLCFSIATLAGHAQTTAQISGRVIDASGAEVPAAQVQATNTDTNAVRTTQTASDGSYVLTALPLGPYKLQVTKAGFQAFVQSGVVLEVGSHPLVNITLKVGSVQQTVEVHANAAMVQTQTAGIGQVVTTEQIVDLPLNGRQATDLIALSGAAVPVSGGGLVGENLDYPTTVGFSIAGSQPNATNYYLDGSPNMDYRTDEGSPMPFPDALQEFKVDTSAMPADLGVRPGGTVSSVTKSGTNSFHGDAFEFLRNGIMDADAYTFPNASGKSVAGIQDNLKRNQFGGTIGGPIKKDKLFFFYGIQETTERQQNPQRTFTIPTPAMMSGDFTEYLGSASDSPCRKQAPLNYTVPSPSGGPAQQLTTFSGSNIMLPGWLNTPSAKLVAKIVSLFPTPTDACGDYTASSYQHDDEYQHLARIDWQHTQNDRIFARYYITNYTLLSSITGGNLLTTSGVGQAARVQNVALGDTHILSPRVVSSFRLYFGRTATQRTGNPKFQTICALGVMATCGVPEQGTYGPGLNLPGYLGYDYENVFGISENVGWQVNTHDLAFGFTGQLIQMNGDGTFQVNPRPGWNTGNTSYTGQAYGDYVAGMLDVWLQGGGQLSRDAQLMPSLYFQDNWQVTKSFEFTYGLRWDPYFPQHNKYKMVSDFSMAGFNAGKTSQVYVNAPPGVTFPGDPGFNDHSDTNRHLADFSPRIGFAWSPGGKGTMSIRSGYGIFYDTSMMWNAMHVVLNPPFGATQSVTPPAPVDVSSSDPLSGGGFINPWYGIAGGNPFPLPLSEPKDYVFPPSGAFVFQDQNAKPAYVQQWNLSIQKQFGENWLASASYIGSKTTHVWIGSNLNPSVIISAGMTAPGIVSTAGMVGTSGPCTLLYQGQQLNFTTCNSPSKVSVDGVSNEYARHALVLANPNAGPAFDGGLTQDQSQGNGAYNGLLLSMRHRLSNGFSVTTNYTWSHCLDTGEIGQDVGASFQNPNNRKAEWGNCGTDRRQVFNLILLGQMPKFSSAWMQRLVGNWSASTIFTHRTGSYSTVSDGRGQDISLTGVGNDRPNQVGDPFQAGTVAANASCSAPSQVRTLQNWFNPCAYEKQAPLTFGNTGRNTLLGPGAWNLDMSLSRSFPLTERFNLHFRAEAFNIFNHPQFGNPGTSLSSTSSLGRITSTVNNNRILQVALRLTF
jgi:Carboxypeptidase regulatory-like domain